MAEIVFGFGVSHGPLLVTPPAAWDLRADWDRRQRAHDFRGGKYSFEELAGLRRDENLEAHLTLEAKTERFERCRRRIGELGEALRAAEPDVLVVAGDDQREWIMPDLQPAFTVFHGESVTNLAFDEARASRDPSIAYRMRATEAPGRDHVYPVESALAVHIIEQLTAAGFDVAASARQPAGPEGPRQLGHAWGFVYRQLLEDRPKPLVPVLVNTFYAPNRPSPKRCYELGLAIGRAIRRWDSAKTVAAGGSGGLSHFVIDEPFDRALLDALERRDADYILALEDGYFRAGTSEIKNWLVAAGMLAETNLRMKVLDYVPCYRSEAGTGCAMGFAAWMPAPGEVPGVSTAAETASSPPSEPASRPAPREARSARLARMRILALCGSLQARSANRELLETARASAPEGVEVVIFEGLDRLPHFNPDIEASGPSPPAVEEWRRALERSEALLVAAPEYGHSLPGSLKNAIDWVIGTGHLERKIVAVTAATVGAERGLRGLQALRQTLGAVNARIVGGEPIVRGETAAAETAKLLRAVLDEVGRGKGRAPGPPFRAEHVGSLLRPKRLKQAMASARAGSIGAAELRAIQDACIREAVVMQEAIGLSVVTDGEFRHESFQHFLLSLEGAVGASKPLPDAPDAFAPRTYAVTGKLRHRAGVEVESFRYLASLTHATPKVTLASPTMLLRAGRDAISREAYPDLEEYERDVAAVYRAEIRALASAGCAYVQFDDTNFAYLCDPDLRSRLLPGGAAQDPPPGGGEQDALPRRYAALINAALAGRPAGMTACLHVCRGNRAGRFASRGGYDPVADVLLNEVEVDGYFLEYDDARSGGFEPLRFLPRDSAKKIVLGLITTKSPRLEPKDEIKRRIEQAAKYVPLENLCLSPQCGFASTIEGNPLSAEDERRKLELVVQIASEVWGGEA